MVGIPRSPSDEWQRGRHQLVYRVLVPSCSRFGVRAQIRSGQNRAKHCSRPAFRRGLLSFESRSFPVDRDTQGGVPASYLAKVRRSRIITNGPLLMCAAKEVW